MHEGLSKIISVCKKSCFDCEMIENLKRINKVFCRLNAQCDDKEWLNAYFNLYKLCNEQFSGKNITNTLLFAPQYEATLGKNVLASLYRLENFATKTALPDNETTAVLYWKKLFKEKYGPYVEINFLELFDDNSGFGDPYAPKNHNIIELGVLNLAEKKIEYCSGCGCCFSHGFCPLDEIDDMKFIKEVFLKADIITIVVPVYAYNVPGIMKSLMDRLASWNHILNLTGKKIMVFTLTHISGAQYVCNYVSNIFSFMGGQIIHYEMLEIVKEMEKIPDLEKLIDIKAIEFVNHADLTQFINKEIVYNHFNALKNSVIRAINLGNLSFETEFWESSGLLNCDSFSEWKEKQLENDISSIK